MKASKFSAAQKSFIIKQGYEGTPVAEIFRKAGISQATYFNWKKRYAGLLSTEMKRLKAKLRDDRTEAVALNSVWAMDLVHDQLATGKARVLTVVDTFLRYVPVLDARSSYRGEDVVATLDRVCRGTGYPKTIRVDQGSEFISRDIALWALSARRRTRLLAPGKADRQCIHRSVQWQVQGGMSERALVLDACRCNRKVGG